MSLNNRPPPLFPTPQRARCPVCGYVSYSATGIHPQCSLRKADAERMQRQRVRVPPPKDTKPEALSPWQKICPRCKAIVHVRKQVCECGCRMTRRS
jgi:hypothetical protein